MKSLSIVTIGIVMMITSFLPAQAQKEKFHSMFIYNFCKYVKWPEDQNKAKLIIGVLGNTEIYKELSAMASNKKVVNGKSIVVIKYKSASELGDCNILYVSSAQSGELSQINATLKNNPVLLVTEKPGMASKGSVINFIEKDGKVKFEFNQSNAALRGLKVSGSLTSLAILV